MMNTTEMDTVHEGMQHPPSFSKILKIKEDMYQGDEVKLFLRGSGGLHDADKRVIGGVVLYYLNGNTSPENISHGPTIKKYIRECLNNKSMDEKDVYETLFREFECTMPEKLLAYLLIGLKPHGDDLLIKLTHVYGRVPRLDRQNDWLNNYSINAYLEVLTLTAYKKYDNADLWTVNRQEAAPINKSVNVNFKLLREKMVGRLRDFMITYNYVPGVDVYSLFNKHSPNDFTDEDVCDISQQIFIGNTFYCHGCDCFYIGMSLSIDDIVSALERYPSTVFFGVLNTQTYESKSGGEHWVYLGLHQKKADLICSQGSDFNVFHDKGKLYSDLESRGFGFNYNMRTIQHDNNNCSFYSVLSAWAMMINDNDIVKSVDYISDDATAIVQGKNIDDVRARLINWKN